LYLSITGGSYFICNALCSDWLNKICEFLTILDTTLLHYINLQYVVH